MTKIYDLTTKGPPPVPAALFRKCLRGLYGEHWKEQGALALDLNHRTVRRMASGERPIPPAIWHALDQLLLGKLASVMGEATEEGEGEGSR